MKKQVWFGLLGLLPALSLLSGCGGGNGIAGGNMRSTHPVTLPGSSSDSSLSTRAISGNPNGVLQRVAKIVAKPGEGSFYTASIDPTQGYAYFGTSGSTHPGYIVKVALGTGNNAPTEVGSIQLPIGQEGTVCSVIDTVHGYAYFGNLGVPARIFKVALGAGSAPPRLVGSLVLNAGENCLFDGAIDVANGVAYFTCATNPAKIVKISLGQGNALPTRVGVTTLAAGSGIARRLLMDPVRGYLYAVTMNGNTSGLVKLTLGSGSALPTQVSSVTLPSGEDHILFGALDAATGYAYLATYNPGGIMDCTTPGKIIKVRLNPGDMAPTRIGSITVPQKYFTSGGIDPNTHYLYVGNDLTFRSSNVLQVATGQGDSLPSVVNSIQLQPGSTSYTFATRPFMADPKQAGEIYIQSGVMDPANGYIYFGTDTHDGQVVKVAIPSK